MKQLFENTWTYEAEGVRFFLLTGTEKALVIDTGMPGLDVLSLVKEHTDLPLELLITHADMDHIGANGQFGECYMHPSEIPHYRHGNAGKGAILPVLEGDVIDLGDRELEIVFLPGHTPGSITVLDRKARCLIGGDPIQEDGEIFMFGPQRSLEAYITGLEQLLDRDDFDRIYPSHAKEEVSREIFPALIEGAEQILAGELDGEEIEMYGQKIRSIDAGVCRFLCDPKE